MFGMGASQGLQADPEVGRIVARVTAAGGQVLRVDRRFVLAEMGKGQGPLWIPVHGRRQAPAQRQAWIA
jgi:predicted oxidoreductase